MKKIIISIFIILITCNYGHTKNINKLNVQGEKYYKDKKYDQALKKFNEALKITPEDVRTLKNLSVTLIKLNKFEESIRHSFKALKFTKKEKEIASIYYNIGLACEKEKKIRDAVFYYFISDKYRPSKTVKEKINNLNNGLFKAPEKKKVVWQVLEYSKKHKSEMISLKLDEPYLKSIPDHLKAVIGYYGFKSGTECWWDGEAKADRSNLKCILNWALGLGYQCSDKQLSFLKKWFKDDKKISEDLKTCPTTPNTATFQNAIELIEIEIMDGHMFVLFHDNYLNMRKGKTTLVVWKDLFKRSGDRIHLLSRSEVMD